MGSFFPIARLATLGADVAQLYVPGDALAAGLDPGSRRRPKLALLSASASDALPRRPRAP